MHVAIIGVAVATAVTNLGMDSVRAETMDAFNKSLAYAVITEENSPLVEEFADMDVNVLRSDATDYLSQASLTPIPGALDGASVVTSNAASFAGGGALAVPVIADAHDSVAPRDGVETYTVADGDTISTIASQFGISVNTILWANNLSVRSVLKLGQSLTILPTSGVLYTVKSGDTLTKLASTYGAEVTEILSANAMSDSSAIAVGQKLVIPGGTPPVAVAVAKPSASTVRSVFVPAPSSSGSKTSATARMTWPSAGHYVVRGLSWTHNGVDIDCDGRADGTSTQDNYAAADGVVTFSGANFSGPNGGYGYLVIIDHGNGITTRYGHNHALYVKTGETVSAGQPVARCGSTGWSSGTHLHFEVRINGQIANPLEYIR